MSAPSPDALDAARLYYASRGFYFAAYNLMVAKWTSQYDKARPVMPALPESMRPAALSLIAESPSVPRLGLLGQIAAHLGLVGRTLLSGSPAPSLAAAPALTDQRSATSSPSKSSAESVTPRAGAADSAPFDELVAPAPEYPMVRPLPLCTVLPTLPLPPAQVFMTRWMSARPLCCHMGGRTSPRLLPTLCCPLRWPPLARESSSIPRPPPPDAPLPPVVSAQGVGVAADVSNAGLCPPLPFHATNQFSSGVLQSAATMLPEHF